jgi:hypothetical protein
MIVMTASSYYRDSHCYANRAMAKEAEQMGVIPPEFTEATERGKRVHAGEPATPDEQEAMTVTLRRLTKEMQSLGEGELVDSGKEKRFYLRDGFIPYFSGQPDRYIIYPKMIVVGDMKPGFEEDWEAWYWQVFCYAAILYENFGKKELVKGVISTRFYGSKSWTWNGGQLLGMIDTIKEVADRFLGSNVRPYAGSWCKYCKARLICKEALQLPAQTHLPVEQLPGGIIGADIVAKLKLVMAIAKSRLDWYRDRVQADQQFLDGQWTLRTKKTPTITDTCQAIDEIYSHNLLVKRDVISCAKISVPELRDKLREKHPGMTHQEAQKTIEQVLGELYQVKESEPWLVEATK